MILDGLLLGMSLYLAHLFRNSALMAGQFGEVPDFSHSFWILAVVIPVSPLILDLNGFYHHPLSQRPEALMGRIFKSGFWLFLIIGAAAIFGRLEVPSRIVMVLFPILAIAVLVARVYLTRSILIRRFRSGSLGERSIIVGSNAHIDSFLDGLTEWERLELQVVETCDPAKNGTDDILRKIRQQSAGRVIFPCYGSLGNEDLLPSSCESEGLDVWITLPDFQRMHAAPVFDYAGRNRILVFRRSTSDFWYDFFKRAIDIVGASLGIVILLLPSLLIAAAVKLTSPGPIIFRQVRSGRRGQRFTILKFRSMVENAPELHGQLSSRNEMSGPVFKITKDPRVTPLGEFLRRTSLDEIPQLLNVLAGEMSIVGPRPLPDYETEKIEKSTHRRRLSVKPGLTCLWQIRGRNSIIDFEDWIKMDLEYIERPSLLLDLRIMIQTVPAVLFGRGAK